MRILAFIGFLLVYATWLAATMWLQHMTRRALLKSNNFWVSELNLVLNLVAIFAFVYLLSGYFNWWLIAALFAATQAGVVLAAILNGFVGSTTGRWGPRVMWAGAEFGMTHQPVAAGALLLSLLITVGYPIVIGVTYFRSRASELPAHIFQYTLSMFFLSGLVIISTFLVGPLVSKNLNEDTRIRLFVNQLSALVPNALWLALVFWSFGIAGTGRKIAVGAVSLEFSPLLLAILIGLFVMTVLLPYLIGAQRARQWRISLLSARKNWMSKLRDILETPAGSLHLPKLAALQNELEREISEFIGSDPIVAAGIQIDQGNVPPAMEAIGEAYRLSRNEDPRFEQLDWLVRFHGKIGEIHADLGKLTTEPDVEKAAKEWIKYLQPREAALQKESGRTSKTRTPALLIASGVIVPIASVMLGEFAKWLWVYFSKSLPT
ncbi:MAG TPA: hypothetical protein VHK90_05785 [Thermoanaerobaculia bacterium]|nr:hypothetical protein [Thermoanaerobaculia bacterium]